MLQNHLHSKRRKILFHFAAMILVISPLVLGELVIRLCVPAHEINIEDPYISFSGIRPLFVPDSTGTHLEIAKERQLCFCPQSFTAIKKPNTFRIFCLGGSTVQGRPYSIETSFTSWLKLNLEAAQSGTNYEVVNCGGISYASYRLVPIMREVLKYKPDLIIIYTGHNEFLEDRTYHRLKRIPRILIRAHHGLLNLRSYSLANKFIASRRAGSTKNPSSSKTILPTEVSAKLDFKGGLKTYHRDDTWRQGTIEHFRYNLQTMVRISQSAGIPIILVNPVSNLKDCPPFKSEFSTVLSKHKTEQIKKLWEQAKKLSWDDVHSKIKLLEHAAQIDSRHAGLLYMIGKCYEQIGRHSEAKKWFIKAKEEDICPLRILEPMHDAVLSVAAKNNVPLVDAKRIFENQRKVGILGDEWLLDHVHPKIEGHQLIADLLYEAMEDMKLVSTPEGWQITKDKLWKEHLSSLSEVYFELGYDRLNRLHNWSRGLKASPPPADSDSSED